jgi:hypothetical protein
MEIVEPNQLTKRQLWNKANKDKLAEYARNYYHKRIDADPNYKTMLCERVKSNNLKKTETKARPGRPRKYPVVEIS